MRGYPAKGMKSLSSELCGIILTRMNESGDFIEEYFCDRLYNFALVSLLYASKKPASEFFVVGDCVKVLELNFL